MKTKTIKKVIEKKLEAWLDTIEDKKLRNKTRKNILVSGGSIASMLLSEQVNDFDIYIQDMDVLLDMFILLDKSILKSQLLKVELIIWPSDALFKVMPTPRKSLSNIWQFFMI